ncbi:Cof-type HAD-IIB family hydrolase [uncultured Clostridium sp.]|uniref:Cof-type HAD-IIB family hydrolase n=1 Tax=uncultured Clostridium sp. TaxID=59620 RepID=UPI002589839A|nr:Cof-type HAD-IIB family hydrolase [uncultured Clostridium sp.]
MAIKLICTDMDGTLLNTDHTVSDKNKATLKKAIDKGIIIAISTGRLFTSANFYRELIGINTPIISSNGAYIKDRNTNKVIYENGLSLEETIEIYTILKNYNLSIFFNTWDTAISDKEFLNNHAYLISNEGITNEEDKTKFIVEKDLINVLNKKNGEILKAICIDYSKENIKEIQLARKEIEKLDKYEVVCSSPYNFEIMKKGTSKGNAVKTLAEMLGINKEEIMCIGDSENDLSMIEYAGVGVAMGNALDIVKEKAKYITLDNDHSGVAAAIEKYAL